MGNILLFNNTPTSSSAITAAHIASIPFQDKAKQYKASIDDMALQLGNPRLSPILIAQAAVESSLDAKVVNSIGACGLFQFMRGTWVWLESLYPDTLSNRSCKDAGANIDATILLFKLNQKRFEDVKDYCLKLSLTIASHNAGAGAVNRIYRTHKDRWKKFLPRETREYLKSINRLSPTFKDKGWGDSSKNEVICTL